MKTQSMKTRSVRFLAVVAVVLGVSVVGDWVVAFAQERPARCGRYETTITPLRTGGRVDWSRSNDLIAYDRPDPADNYHDVWVMSLDGTVDYCVTCSTPEDPRPVPQKNNGNPAWHPSGNYIVFQSELADSTANPHWSNPGRGLNNVLWVTDATGTEFHQVTVPPPDAPGVVGVLHPHFSNDGELLSWSEMYEAAQIGVPGKVAGFWRLKVARFVTDDGPPRLEGIDIPLPSVPGFYENHGFSPDDSRLIYSSNSARTGYFDRLNNDIFTLELGTGAVTRLTDTAYNEHAGYFPSGEKVIWVTNRNISSRGTDLWIMNPDGTQKQRLTFFNRIGCPEDAADRVVPADSSINATGDKIVVYVLDEIQGDTGTIVLIELASPF